METINKWVDHIPEIVSRPKAFAAAEINIQLRRDIIRIANGMVSMGRKIAGHPWAESAIMAAYKEQLSHFNKWQERLPHSVWNQCVSTLKHARSNAVKLASYSKVSRWNNDCK